METPKDRILDYVDRIAARLDVLVPRIKYRGRGYTVARADRAKVRARAKYARASRQKNRRMA